MEKGLLLDSFEIMAGSEPGISGLHSLLNSLAIRQKLGTPSTGLCRMDEFIHELEKSKSNFFKQHQPLPKRKAKLTEGLTLGFDLPIGWGLVSLEKLCYAQAGFAFSAGSFNSEGIGLPLIRIRDIEAGHSNTFYSGEYRPEFLVQTGDWLTGMDGNFRVRQWKGGTALLNQRVTRLKFFDERINQKFVTLALQEHLSSLMGTKSYTTVDHLSTKQIESAPIPLPCIEEQDQIIARLEKLTAGVTQLGELQKSLRKSDLAARKASIQAISTAQTPEELQTAWARIQENWELIAGGPESVESLRELLLDVLFRPRNRDEWLTKSFGELLSLSNGDRSKNYPSKEHRVSTGIPFVNAGHLNNGRVNMSDMDYITREKYESLGGGKFKDGDVLFCLRGSLGKSALVRDVGEGAIASSLAILRVGGELDAEYLFWFLQSGMARVQIKNFDNGTAQPNLAAKNVLKFKLPLPPLNQQRNIVSRVGELIEICDQLEASMIEAEDIAHRFARSVVLSSS